MAIKREHNQIVVLLAAVFLLAASTSVAALVTPIYEITGFGGFGPVVGGPLATNFGGGMFELTGTLTSTVYRAEEAFELNQGEDTAYIDVDYLTFVYRIDVAPSLGDINYMQVDIPFELDFEQGETDPIVAVGWNSIVSDVNLTEVNIDPNDDQVEFGNKTSTEPGAFNLSPGQTIEVFVTFRDLEYSQTSAQIFGGAFDPGNIDVLGPELPEPASIGTALTALLGLCGIIAHRCRK